MSKKRFKLWRPHPPGRSNALGCSCSYNCWPFVCLFHPAPCHDVHVLVFPSCPCQERCVPSLFWPFFFGLGSSWSWPSRVRVQRWWFGCGGSSCDGGHRTPPSSFGGDYTTPQGGRGICFQNLSLSPFLSS
jgi:hypothetical protein